ncbi:KTSC domain-containing protein [Acinetobacter guillouiae]|uniref:KTSC domain-containing protein n=1 Tax=Acinetobacter guillouiae TaxID=106649 RepID=A0A8X8GEB7_ACIGI|nr:KTSC domain-containing protein [Acinetobacter guillouiae]MCF0265508.1 KTSC domain-containing protein [Acinetobacter guillouiae]
MRKIEINSKKIKRVLYQRYLLTVELMTGEKFLYQMVSIGTFNEFINTKDKDKYYKSHIKANKEFKRFQLFV